MNEWRGSDNGHIATLESFMKRAIGKTIKFSELGTSTMVQVKDFFQIEADKFPFEFYKIKGKFILDEDKYYTETILLNKNSNLEIINIDDQMKVCTCPIDILINMGCTCGGFESEMKRKRSQ